jgi:hypothetical protein
MWNDHIKRIENLKKEIFKCESFRQKVVNIETFTDLVLDVIWLNQTRMSRSKHNLILIM